MCQFELFKKVIVGKFNNDSQIEREKKEGTIIHPLAKHVNTICNKKIKNLPEDFKGIFVIEESYYTNLSNGMTNVLPHLFLFEEDENGQVKLTSYDLPKEVNKKDFTASNKDLEMDFNNLNVSLKFNPMIYQYKEGVGFYGKSLSNFSSDTTFLLEETLSYDKFEVNEVLKKGEKVLVGFPSPIEYIREK